MFFIDRWSTSNFQDDLSVNCVNIIICIIICMNLELMDVHIFYIRKSLIKHHITQIFQRDSKLLQQK